MSIESITLLSNITAEAVIGDSTYNFSEKQRGSGYYKNGDGLHTITYDLLDFAGSIKIQATLELYPGNNDWFDIVGTEIGGDSTTIAAATMTRNFTGKFVWIRAAYNLQNGTITEIRYNL
jgi:hypothetical protein